MSKPGVLYLIPTPLAETAPDGFLAPSVREVISNIDILFTENVRTARRFIASLRLGKEIDDITFHVLNKDTPPTLTHQQLNEIPEGVDTGVMSEAGCPGVADPGATIVNLAHRLGRRVIPLVGPSSILLALMASGMSGQAFAFHGYLPIDKSDRRLALRKLDRNAAEFRQTQIFMETPFRNQQMFEAVLGACSPSTQLCIAANITAADEFIRTKSIDDWLAAPPPDLHKKPTIFLLGTDS